jgi:hypothetical protein
LCVGTFEPEIFENIRAFFIDMNTIRLALVDPKYLTKQIENRHIFCISNISCSDARSDLNGTRVKLHEMTMADFGK